MNAAKLIENLQNLHGNITDDVWPDGWHGECRKCGKPFYYNNDECARYLAHGWPECTCKDKLKGGEE